MRFNLENTHYFILNIKDRNLKISNRNFDTLCTSFYCSIYFISSWFVYLALPSLRQRPARHSRGCNGYRHGGHYGKLKQRIFLSDCYENDIPLYPSRIWHRYGDLFLRNTFGFYTMKLSHWLRNQGIYPFGISCMHRSRVRRPQSSLYQQLFLSSVNIKNYYQTHYFKTNELISMRFPSGSAT